MSVVQRNSSENLSLNQVWLYIKTRIVFLKWYLFKQIDLEQLKQNKILLEQENAKLLEKISSFHQRQVSFNNTNNKNVVSS